MGDRTRQAGLGDKPRRRTQHPRHMETNGREVGTQHRKQEKDKTREGDTASQTKDKLGALVKLPILLDYIHPHKTSILYEIK